MADSSRGEAEAAIAPLVRQHGQYKYVRADDARVFLGSIRFGRLQRDRVRGLGPLPDTFYPWNVADYEQFPELKTSAELRRITLDKTP